MGLTKYRERKEEIIKILEEMKCEIKNDEIKSFMDKKIETLKEDRFVVSVFGSFSNGKSSFLNALMGFKEEILVIDEKASTAAITKIMYPKNENLLNKGEIIYQDGKKEIVELEEIKKYCARNNEVYVEQEIKEVILYLNSEILKNGVEIVDTPGFNSTHGIHTDIARNYIENSNASIFLFDYSKPGGQSEFKFLGEINDKMDKIFLVLNKIDLENKTETTLENTMKILRCNIEKEGADIRNKEIHPISARLELEALLSNESDKYFKEFKETLENYLVSEENVKDRLKSPVKKVIYKLNDYRKIEKNIMDEIALEEKDLEMKILEKEEKIEDGIEELKKRKKLIKRTIDDVIREAVRGIGKGKAELIEELKETMSGYKTKYSLRRCDFEGEVQEIEKKTRANIEEKVERLSEKIQEIVEENIDDEDELAVELKNSINKNIKINVKFKEKKYDRNNESILDISDIEEKLERLKEEVDEARADYNTKGMEKKENDEKLDEIRRKKEEIKELREEKNKRINDIGEGELKCRPVYEKEKAVGFFGAIKNICCGGDTVERDVYDSTEIENCERRRAKVEASYDERVKKEENELKEIKKNVKYQGMVESELDECRETYVGKNRDLREARSKAREEEMQREEVYVEVRKHEYIREVRKAIEEAVAINEKAIKNNKDAIKKIVLDSLNGLQENIEREKDIVMILKGANGKGRDDLNLMINEKSNIITKVDKYIEILGEAE